MGIHTRRRLFSAGAVGKAIPWDGIHKVASLGIATTALGVSLHRNKKLEEQSKQQREIGDEQLKAMRHLTDTLSRVDNSMQKFEKDKFDSPKKVEEKKKGFFRKMFSIESGSYSGGKRSLNRTSILGGAAIGAAGGAIVGGAIGGAAIGGAVIGAGIGAFSAWMCNIADKSLFNSGFSRDANSYNLIQAIEEHYYLANQGDDESTEVSQDVGDGTTIKHTRTSRAMRATSPKGIVYDIDKDPRGYVVNALYRGNVMVLYLNRPDRQELGALNRCLDDYCYSYKNADYAATQVSSGSYAVELFVVEGAEASIALSLINAGFKINIITGSKFGHGKI